MGYDLGQRLAKIEHFLGLSLSGRIAPAWCTVVALLLAGCNPPSVRTATPDGLTVEPPALDTAPGAVVMFVARGSEATTRQVVWDVDEQRGGSIDALGRYRAPELPGTYHVVARSALEPTVSAIATVRVQTPTSSGAVEAVPISSSEQIGSTNTSSTRPAPVLAFPGAEGAGAVSVGGRGGTVMLVTNLNDSGPGSLRACMEASGARTCIFRVSGVIRLSSAVAVTNSYLTVAGQTAPGAGITVTHDPAACTGPSCQGLIAFSSSAHDVLVRYLRLRHLTPTSSQGAYNLSASGSRMIFDHVSMSWAANDSFEINGGPSNVTLSWSIIADGLAGHNTSLMLNPEGASDLSTAVDWDVHHTAATGTHRIPKVGNKRARFVSNLFHPLYTYNDLRCVTNPFTGGSYDYIANYFKEGPKGPICEILPASESISTAYAYYPGVPSLFVSGNRGPNDPAGVKNANLIFKVDPADDDEHPQTPLVVATPGVQYVARTGPLDGLTAPISAESVGTGGATLEATLWTDGHPTYGPIGASQRLDCSGRFVGAQDLFDQGVKVRYDNNSIFTPDDENDSGYDSSSPERRVNGVATTWGNVLAQINANPGDPCADADGDGIPDEYEIARCGTATCLDANGVAANGYTNLENFLNAQ